MRAFEIYLNGKKLCVAGLDSGTLLLSVGCTENSLGRGEVGLSMTGMLLTQETVRWQHRSLRMNDEVRIRIIESPKSHKYKVLQKAPSDSRKYEKAYVRRMARNSDGQFSPVQGRRKLLTHTVPRRDEKRDTSAVTQPIGFVQDLYPCATRWPWPNFCTPALRCNMHPGFEAQSLERRWVHQTYLYWMTQTISSSFPLYSEAKKEARSRRGRVVSQGSAVSSTRVGGARLQCRALDRDASRGTLCGGGGAGAIGCGHRGIFALGSYVERRSRIRRKAASASGVSCPARAAIACSKVSVHSRDRFKLSS